NHFKERVIEPSVKEIQEVTTLKVSYTEVKYSRSVEDIIFHLERTQPNKD
ncbi:MAG: replication initiation protein, partial [Bacteroidales bacterium]|nr:replication initiation protein [Bacteroidales bacterium]